ncbi:hypothetical protein [Paracoccus benzoatiresistens]|uniref:Uncharacterized protein n=1 Tax=Paracoccus benzoatiresistens TaxID=2997341 RepID=A0ABT4J9S9_9RHOB|nr:hypothetical protein [Paracoccus sp. EF6]MCZ0963888.1 hypothetical protein [Paracoccus sp. EF6]
MARLINPGLRAVPLPTGHVVPRQGELTTTNDVLRCPDNAAFLNGQIVSGQLLAEYDPDPELPPEPVAATPAAEPAAAPTPEKPVTGKAKGA